VSQDNPAAGGSPRLLSAASVMLVLLSLAYFLAYFDRLLMAVVGESVKHEFLLSDKQLSLLTGAFFVILYGAFGILGGWLGDHMSRKKIIAWSLAVWSCLTVFCGYSHTFLQLAFARAGVGIGESAMVPVANSALSDLYPVTKRPMAIAIFYAGGLIGILACFVLGTWVATHYGWRSSFLVAGPPGLLLALLIAVFAREPAREVLAEPAAGATTDAVADKSSFLLVWHNRPLVWLLAGSAIATFVNIGVVQWLPNFFIRSHHLSLQQVGLYFGPVLSLGMTAGMLFGGWLGNRMASRSVAGGVAGLIWFSAITMLTIAPVYLLIFWLPSLTAALAVTFIGTALSVIYSPSYSGAWQTLCHPHARGTAAGMSSFANAILGGALCSFFIGSLSDYWEPTLGKESLRYALMVGMSFSLIAAACMIRSALLTATQERNAAHKRAVKDFYGEVLSGARPERLVELVAPDYRPHLASFRVEPVLAAGSDALAARLRDVGPIEHRLVRLVADGELVFAHVKYPGPVPYAGVDIFRFDAGGRICEHWNVRQGLPKNANQGEDRFTTEVRTAAGYSRDRGWLKARLRRVLLDMWGKGNAALVPEFYDDAYIQHNADMPGGARRILEIVQQNIRQYIDATGGPYPIDIHTMAAEGDIVCVHLSISMAGINRHEGARSTNVDIFRVNQQGRMVEHWDVLEMDSEPLESTQSMF
jgi:MFS family permease